MAKTDKMHMSLFLTLFVGLLYMGSITLFGAMDSMKVGLTLVVGTFILTKYALDKRI